MPSKAPAIADQILDPTEATVLDLLDRLLDKGVMVNGDVTLGVAGVDLIYLRLSALLCAADRLMPTGPTKGTKGTKDTKHKRRATRRRTGGGEREA